MFKPDKHAIYYLILICVQFAAVILVVLHSREQDRQLTLLQNEAGDWEQISETWKHSSITNARAADTCLQTIRTYQRQVFQPQEMSK